MAQTKNRIKTVPHFRYLCGHEQSRVDDAPGDDAFEAAAHVVLIHVDPAGAAAAAAAADDLGGGRELPGKRQHDQLQGLASSKG